MQMSLIHHPWTIVTMRLQLATSCRSEALTSSAAAAAAVDECKTTSSLATVRVLSVAAPGIKRQIYIFCHWSSTEFHLLELSHWNYASIIGFLTVCQRQLGIQSLCGLHLLKTEPRFYALSKIIRFLLAASNLTSLIVIFQMIYFVYIYCLLRVDRQ